MHFQLNKRFPRLETLNIQNSCSFCSTVVQFTVYFMQYVYTHCIVYNLYVAVLRNHLNFDADPGSNLKKRIRIQVINISLRFIVFFNKRINFKFMFLLFSLIFMIKLDEPFREMKVWINSFSTVQLWGLRAQVFLVDNQAPGSVSRKPKCSRSNGSIY